MNGDVSDRNAGGRSCRPSASHGRIAPRFIAEVSSNHHRDLDRCLAFIDRAAEIGCDGVKFQLFRVRELFAPEILAASPKHREREQWELPPAYLEPLAERARARGIAFGCTPFDLRAVEELRPWVDFYKVASYELLWDDLIAACARTGKPLVLSTGMADAPEVEHAFDVATAAGARDLTILHCVSTYPTPADEANLAVLGSLRSLSARAPEVDLQLGWSDHSLEPGVIHRAIHRHGAEMVEFHLDLDGDGEEYGSGHCWLPDAIGEVIRQVRAGLSADGSGRKRPVPSEVPERPWRADPSDGLRPLRATRVGWSAP